jgi:two-component system response regulator FixJ
MSEHPEPVLLVDDDLAVRSSLKFALEQEGLVVRAYGSGAELLADPDLPPSGCLVVDYNMPGMNGVELADRLEKRHLHYPVILITSGLAHDIRGIAAHPHIQAVLEKPLEGDALLVRIQAALTATAVPRHGAGSPSDPPTRSRRRAQAVEPRTITVRQGKRRHGPNRRADAV